MRVDFGPRTMLYPMPVLMVGSYDENDVPDLMNAAWGGIHDTDQVGICLSKEHKTTANILKSGEFTVSVGVEGCTAACDYVGIVSANDVPDKVVRAGLTPVCASKVHAPVFLELPFALECRLLSYDPESGAMVGQIVNVSADESVLGEDGKVDIALLKPLLLEAAHDLYYGVGSEKGAAFRIGHTLEGK